MNNKITIRTYTANGFTDEVFDISKARLEIEETFKTFIEVNLKQILSSKQELLDKYFPEDENDPKSIFPITMVSPGLFQEYEVRYKSDTLKNYPKISNVIDNESKRLQTDIMNIWSKQFN